MKINKLKQWAIEIARSNNINTLKREMVHAKPITQHANWEKKNKNPKYIYLPQSPGGKVGRGSNYLHFSFENCYVR